MRSTQSAFGIVAALMLLTSGCIDAALTDSELQDRIDKQSKPYPTAVMLADCLGRECQKNSNTCYDICFAEGSEEAKTLGDPLWSCWKAKCQSSGAAGDELEDMTKCLMLKCAPELRSIIIPGKTGATDCPGTLTCMEQCDPSKTGLFTCYQQCFDEATDVGRNALTQCGECASKIDGEQGDACHAEIVACFSDIQLDSGKCVTFAACSEACPSGKNNDACTLQCRDRLDDDGKKKFDDLLPCFAQGVSTPKCSKAVASCIEPSGPRSCLDTYRCASNCHGAISAFSKKDKIGCLYSCMHNGTPDAAENITKIGNCQPGGDSNKCMTGLVDCSAPKGEGSCPGIQTCNDECNKQGGSDNAKVVCLLECLHDAKPAAAKAYTDVLGCYTPCENSCGKSKNCQTKCANTCKKELAACSTS